MMEVKKASQFVRFTQFYSITFRLHKKDSNFLMRSLLSDGRRSLLRSLKMQKKIFTSGHLSWLLRLTHAAWVHATGIARLALAALRLGSGV